MLNRIFHVGNQMNPKQDFLTPGVVSAHVIGEIKKFINIVDKNNLTQCLLSSISHNCLHLLFLVLAFSL